MLLNIAGLFWNIVCKSFGNVATPYIFEGLFNKSNMTYLNNKLMTGNEMNNNNNSVIFM